MIIVAITILYWYYCSVVYHINRMSLSNDTDHVLSTEEVSAMLLEDAINEDAEFAKIKKYWTKALKQCWRSKSFCDQQPHKVRVKAWKEEQTYVFATQDKRTIYKQSLCGKAYGYRCITEISYLTAMPSLSELEGLCIAEIEEILAKFFLKDWPIKCLLDAGFTLKLIVPRDFLGL